MRYILTNNSHVQFIEADDNGKILKSIGFEFGGVYYQTTSNKVTFYLKDQDQPWVNNVWSADIPLQINGEVYSTPEEVGVQLSTIMTDGNIADKIADIEADIAEIVTNESALTDSLDAEIERATSAETEIANDLDAEIARATSAEEDLDDKIDAEITRANAEETRIEGLINDEVTRSTNKDTEHDTLISGLTNDLADEVTRATTAENNLRTDLTAEIARAEGEEARIEGLINAEVTRSTAKDAAQDALISGLTNSLQNEINRAQGAENGLRNDLNNEVSARTTADAEQLQRITALEVGKANASDVYTKAESDAKYVTKEYISGNTYTKSETDALIADFYDGVEYDSNAKRINFMHGNAIKSYIDASEFIKDGMVDNVVIQNGYLVITFNTDSGKEAISIPLSDIFDPTNYYTKSEVDASQSAQDTKITALSGDVTTISGDVQTISGNVQTISGDVHTISGDVQVLDGKIDTLSGNIVTLSGEVQTLSSETVTISGSVNTLSGEVQTIQSEIDDIDLSNYYNKTEVDDLLDDKLDASAYTPTDLSNYYTKSEVDASQSAQDTKINEISGNVTTISGDVQTISGNVTTLNEKVETISGNVQTISGEVQTLSSEIDDIDLSNYYTKSESDGKYQLKGDYVTGAQLSAFTYDKATIDEKVAGGGSFDPTQYYNKTQTNDLLDTKLDVSAYTPTDLSNYYDKTEVDGLLDDKQNTLVAGSGISIQGNVISSTGGGSITVDSALDSGSTNPVENRVIYNKIDEVEQVTAAAFNNLNDSLNDKQDTLIAGSGISIVNNVISATGSGGVTPADVQTMIDSSISGKTDESDFSAHTANTAIHVSQSEKDYWDGKSDFSGDYDDLINQPTEVSTFNNDAGYITASDLDEYPTTSDVLNLIDESVSGKQDTLIAGSGISIQGNVISATGGSTPIDAYTKAESDAKFATITNFNSHSGNTTMHVTAAEKNAWNAKADASNVYTKTEVNNLLDEKPNIWCGDETAWSQISGSTEQGTIYLVY